MEFKSLFLYIFEYYLFPENIMSNCAASVQVLRLELGEPSVQISKATGQDFWIHQEFMEWLCPLTDMVSECTYVSSSLWLWKLITTSVPAVHNGFYFSEKVWENTQQQLE